jgi:hypothetical protein
MDPAVVLHLQKLLGYTPEQVDTLLNKKSGEVAGSCSGTALWCMTGIVGRQGSCQCTHLPCS